MGARPGAAALTGAAAGVVVIGPVQDGFGEGAGAPIFIFRFGQQMAAIAKRLGRAAGPSESNAVRGLTPFEMAHRLYLDGVALDRP